MAVSMFWWHPGNKLFEYLSHWFVESFFLLSLPLGSNCKLLNRATVQCYTTLVSVYILLSSYVALCIRCYSAPFCILFCGQISNKAYFFKMFFISSILMWIYLPTFKPQFDSISDFAAVRVTLCLNRVETKKNGIALK